MAEVLQAFDSLASWSSFVAENPYVSDPQHIRKIVDQAAKHGVKSALLGRIGPDKMEVRDENYRESLLAAGLNSRQRAVMELIALEPWAAGRSSARIYAAEALTPFALAMRGLYPRFIGSEYVSGQSARDELFPIAFQDLTSLTFPSATFDCVITNDVLEHIYEVKECLGELARVLRPDGVMLSTFPFSFRQESIVQAQIVNGSVEHLTEPEYHGNPAEPEKGSLVFTIPGWQILCLAKQVGFSRCEMVFVSSAEHGITGAELAGIMVMRCYR